MTDKTLLVWNAVSSDEKVWVRIAFFDQAALGNPRALPELYEGVKARKHPLPEDLWGLLDKVSGASRAGLYRAIVDADALEAGMARLGFLKTNRVIVWFDPQDVAFGVSKGRSAPFSDGFMVFAMTRDRRSPYMDRLEHDLLRHPFSHFDDVEGEGYWSMKEFLEREDIIHDLTAQGYHYDPTLDPED